MVWRVGKSRPSAHCDQLWNAALSSFEVAFRRPCSTLFSQDGALGWIHVVNLMAYRTSYGLIYVVVLGGILGGKTLNAVSSFRAVVREKRHANLSKSRFQVINYGCLPSAMQHSSSCQGKSAWVRQGQTKSIRQTGDHGQSIRAAGAFCRTASRSRALISPRYRAGSR